ncbi:disease resistance protein RGA2 isoform X2 [Spinacia oleracea]|uniref:Disease resistance protein RGA2 isoform X2 n=2 Tax=Spinacia oleracea TaxID=3562 RepID=A0ABM3QKE2_SPIOL|nr:disease resistance protein RGA2-like isoform X2 [Spinacia oleracea]
MAESIISGVVVKLLEYMSHSTVNALTPYLGGRRKLKELNRTMKLIQARLLDAERRGEGKMTKHLFMAFMLCSSSNPVIINKKIAREAKVVIGELEAIRSDMSTLNLRVLSFEERVINSMNGRETSSFISEEEVIGRDGDKTVIVQMLLDADHVEAASVSIIPIVGIGGLGKTTLAQLAYNDKDVQKHFELKGWACVSGISSVEELSRKILIAVSLVTDEDDYQQLNMDQLQSCLREVVDDKRYLLVLDDVWDEDRERWLVLRRLLFGGKRGSKIIVTSRSGVVAQNLGTVQPYELGGLLEDESWALFKSLAFKEGQQKRNPRVTTIGKEIVKKCANVPLAIRTIAGLLYSKDTEQEWECFKDSELRMIEQNDNSVMSTLKLSYDHLPSHLKQCFAYCSLFPKDYEIDKQCLIYLWMAQGFIRSSTGNETPEDIGHAYFMELLRRSFFQDVIRNEYDDVISCKMHSLMNDLARNMASDDCLLIERPNQQITNTDCIFHLSLNAGSAPLELFAAKTMRSLLVLSDSVLQKTDKMFSSMRCLRSLDLFNASCKSLPNSIEELKHLRYVRLGSSLESLPYGITKLKNLCTLDIKRCYKLKELPRGFNKLIKLRNLHNGERLIDMPSCFGELTSLRALDIFIVGESNGLDALARLNNLAGELKICYVKHRQKAVSEARAANLKDKKMTNLFVKWSSSYVEHDVYADVEEDVLKWLQPPPSVKRLKVWGWKGVQFPRWGMNEFPYLVYISIRSCHRCNHLPSFSRLPHLRFLRLCDLSVLEYIESGGDDNSIRSSSAEKYFPSLESLMLLDLPELKGWSRLEEHQNSLMQRLYFPCVSELWIEGCSKLMWVPVVPRLESLDANEIHGKLLKDLLSAEESALFTMKWLNIHSVQELVSLSINLFTGKALLISECQELIHLVAESPTFLHRLVIEECCRLTDISSALLHLSVLKELEIRHCEELDFGYNSIKSTAWHGLKSLCSLELWDIPKIEMLPEEVGSLTVLQRLKIVSLANLRALPEWIGNLSQLRVLEIRECPKIVVLPESFHRLTSLQELRISLCPELQRRCEFPDGENWPLIQHIPDISVV